MTALSFIRTIGAYATVVALKPLSLEKSRKVAPHFWTPLLPLWQQKAQDGQNDEAKISFKQKNDFSKCRYSSLFWSNRRFESGGKSDTTIAPNEKLGAGACDINLAAHKGRPTQLAGTVTIVC